MSAFESFKNSFKKWGGPDEEDDYTAEPEKQEAPEMPHAVQDSPQTQARSILTTQAQHCTLL